ncbi:MAG: hypothetical protein HY231_11210 [Acidobacteria bacterium]|nr:hypothetical protein [Acidobacteriota bacterium]
MKPTTLLRIASVLAFLQLLAHTFLFLRASPSHGVEEVAVVEAMKTHYFNFGGFTRSYWDFYFGYGIFAAFNVFIEGVLFWQLATVAKTEPSRIKPMAALFCFANIVYALLCLKFFFIIPVVPDVALAIILALAYIAARQKRNDRRLY